MWLLENGGREESLVVVTAQAPVIQAPRVPRGQVASQALCHVRCKVISAEAASPKPSVWRPWMPRRHFPEGAASIIGAAHSPQFGGPSFACCSTSAPSKYNVPWGWGHTGPRLDLLELCLVAGAEGPRRELITNCTSVTGSATGTQWNNHLPAVCLTLPCCF